MISQKGLVYFLNEAKKFFERLAVVQGQQYNNLDIQLVNRILSEIQSDK